MRRGAKRQGAPAEVHLQPVEPTGLVPVPQPARAIKLQIQSICAKLVLDKLYLQSIQRKLREGRMPPQMEAVIWYYAFGKPVEKVEIEERRSVRIIHEYITPADLAADLANTSPRAPGIIDGSLDDDIDRSVGGDARASGAGTDDGPDTLEPEAGRVHPE